ncbi:MAG: CBM35 domain-containing protein [Sedimentisphaerales bacterium]
MKRMLFPGVFVLISLFYAAAAMAFDSSPVGWASYNTIAHPDPTQTPNLNGTTGGAGGTVVTVTDENDLLKWAGALMPDRKTHPTNVNILGPYIIQVQGTINLTGRVDIMPNRTVIGIGTNPTITGANLRVRGAGSHPSYNVIIRRLIIKDSTKDDKDGITIQENAHHVWVDHCTISNCSDGALDITHASDYITVSWNYFYNQDKTCLLGHSKNNATEDTGHFKVTYHHNYFGAVQRQPRVRFAFLCHVYNNYYVAPADPTNNYGIASTCDAFVLAEGNYFKNMLHPMFSILYSDDPNGWLIERDNIYDNSGTPEVNPPASMPEPSTYYSYTLDNTNDIPAIVQYGAGADGNEGYPPHWLFTMYGDFDRSGFVDMNDFAQFARYWQVNDCNQITNADYNGDCQVNFYEFALFAGNWLYIPPDTTPPAAPSGFWAQASSGTVSLDWNDNNEPDFAGYNIYRSTTYGGSYTKLNTSLLSSSNYVDNTVSNGTMYYYAATAADTSLNESGYSHISAEPNTGNPSVIIQEENYGFCGVDGAVESEWSGYTGAGYANTTNASGKGINWKINISSDGTYTFKWRYALVTGDRTAKLIVNGVAVVPSISFPASGVLTTYIETSAIDVNLTAGIKDIRLEATTSDGLANIDYIKVTGNNPAAASCN